MTCSDMMVLRGVNVFPTQIEELVLRIPAPAAHCQCVLTRPGRLDELTVRVERRDGVKAAAADEAGAAVDRMAKDTIGGSSAGSPHGLAVPTPVLGRPEERG